MLGYTRPSAQTPLGRHPRVDRHLPTSDTTGYGQQAGGTHATGMHSCCNFRHINENRVPISLADPRSASAD